MSLTFINKLSANQIQKIIKQIYGKAFFVSRSRVATPTKNHKLCKDKTITGLYDYWAVVENNTLKVALFDYQCHWSVIAYLNDFSIYIPKHQEKQELNKKYIKIMSKLFKDDYFNSLINHIKQPKKTIKKGEYNEK